MVLDAAGRIVPAARRSTWREEWDAEVWHHLHGRDGAEPSVWDQVQLALRCLGAIPHAVWIQGEEWHMESFGQDVRYAVRSLLKRPAFAAVAIVTLALGIGGNTAVFSVVDSVLLEPIPVPNGQRLVYVFGRDFPSGPGASISPPDYLDYREGTSDVFETFAAYGSFSRTVVAEGTDRPEELSGRAVTPDLLRALGYEPAAGRGFTEPEASGDRADVVMISHGLWGRRWGYDPGAVGATLLLDGEPHTVVGVLPRDLGWLGTVDLWFPVTFAGSGYDSRAAHFFRGIALLREGVTPEEAQVSMDRVSARLEQAYPETNDGWYAQAVALQEVWVGDVRPALLVLLGGVGVVLLIACANVANLLLARAAARRGEVAVRAAMGASRVRLVRQVLTESLVLAAVAGVVGIGVAHAGVWALGRLEPGNLPRMSEVGVDGTALAFTLVISLGVGLLFGLAPALGLRTERLDAAMGSVGRSRAERGRRLRDGLVATEVGLSFVLLIGAGLMLRSFQELRAVDPGFETEGALVVSVAFPERLHPELDDVEATREAVLQALRDLPGVEAVGSASILPLSGSVGDTYVYAEDDPPARERDVANTAQIRLVDEGYFETMGIPLVAGRSFRRSDDRDAPHRIVLNERLANDLFPGQDPLGRRVMVWLDEVRPLEVIGVAADVRQYALGSDAGREFYVSARQRGARSLEVVVRGRGGATPAVDEVRGAVWSVDPGQPLARATTLESFVDDGLARNRFEATLMGMFAALALLLAGVGIYGVLAQAVADRRREIGIRIAMGAERREVVGMVVGRGVKLALVGLALGVVGAAAASGALRSMLYEVGTADPLTYALTPLFLLAVVVVSSWLPARQAARTDPAAVLRDE